MTADPNHGVEAVEAMARAGEDIEARQEANQEDTRQRCKYVVLSSKNIYRLYIAVD
jgi:hypothetical protein